MSTPAGRPRASTAGPTSRSSPSSPSSGSWRVSLGALGALLIALGALLLWPLLPVGGATTLEPSVRALLVDRSASVVRRRPEWAAWVRARLRAEVEGARAAGEHVALVAYAGEVQRLFGPAPAEELADWIDGRGRAPLSLSAASGGEGAAGAAADAETLLAEAVALARPWVRSAERETGCLVVLGDRGFTGADPDPALRSLTADGNGLRWIDVERASRADAALLELELPRRLEEGAPLVARARVHLDPGTGGGDGPPRTLDLIVDIGRGPERRRVELPAALELPRGAPARTAEIDIDLGAANAGLQEIEARVRVEGDPLPENDARSAAVRVQGARVIALLASAELRPVALRFLADLAGLQVVPLAPEDFPSEAERFDAVVSIDLPLRALPARALESFVLGGGGWLRAEGWSFLQPGVPRLESLSPLGPHPGDADERDVLVLVDGSGSMAGEPFEAVRAATLELVVAVRPNDEVTLRFFTSGLQAGRLLRARGAAGTTGDVAVAASELLSVSVPRGPTRILHSLEQLAGERAGAEREQLVLLLTDGREDVGALRGAERFETLREELAASRTELAVIAVGASADLDFLARLVPEDAALRRAERLSELEDLFQERVHGERVRTGSDLALRWAPGARLAPSDPEPLPSVERFARAQARPGAERLWIDGEGEPVLAFWRAGLGRVATWTTLPAPGWAPRWSGAGALLAPVLRELARRPDGRPPRARFDGSELRVEWFGAGDAPREAGAALRASVLAGRSGTGPLSVGDPEEELLSLDLPPLASAGGVRLEGAFGRPLAPSEVRRMLPRSGGGSRFLLLETDAGSVGPIPIEADPAPEFRPVGASRSEARSLVAAAHGTGPQGSGPQGSGAGGNPDGRERAPSEPHPLGPWIVAAGMLLLLAGALGWTGAGGDPGAGVGQGIRGSGR